MRHLYTGIGVDAHRFAQQGYPQPLWLACLQWDGPGLEGESDGDVAAHALIDALLAAAHLGDIGSEFGVGAHSPGAGLHGFEMLRSVARHLRSQGYEPVNASVVIVGERPVISPRRAEAEHVLSSAIGCRISLSATTTDTMGFTGSGTGLAAMATALVREIESG